MGPSWSQDEVMLGDLYVACVVPVLLVFNLSSLSFVFPSRALCQEIISYDKPQHSKCTGDTLDSSHGINYLLGFVWYFLFILQK